MVRTGCGSAILMICALGLARAALAQTGASPLLVNPSINQIMWHGMSRLLFGDHSAVNAGRNPGLASTYAGSPTYFNQGSMRSGPVHLQLTGYTRGWDIGTCVLAVDANAPSGTSGCGQGGFFDISYRANYPGQDGEAAFFYINGIAPVANGAAVRSFGSATLTNLGGQDEVVGSLVLKAPLSETQRAAINGASGPMRVQVNNGFMGYVIPNGFTRHGAPVPPMSEDGKTLLVDNWTRSITSTNAGPRDAPGASATSPTFPYATVSGVGRGSGILPDMVGSTNGSAPLAAYTVTIDANYLAEAQYGGFRVGNSDIVQAARYIEIAAVNNKTGTSRWDESEPTNDTLNGATFLTHLIFAACQNDDSVGNGVCGALLMASNGIKRVVVCDNPQVTSDEGATDCALDTKSSFGYHSTKSNGFAMYIDPGATGSPRMVVDYNGNFASSGNAAVANLNVGNAGAVKTTLHADGSATFGGPVAFAQGIAVTGGIALPGPLALPRYKVSTLPACRPGVVAYASDGRNIGERTGAGSGAMVFCNNAGAWLANGAPVTK